MTDLIFRLASHEDVKNIVRLVNSVYRGQSSRKGWTTEADLLDGQRTDEGMILKMLNTEGSVFVLAFDVQGQLLGSVNLENKQSYAYLGMLSVDADHQNKKIGARLLLECEKIVRNKWTLSEIQMTVISLREELISFYVRRGYQKTSLLIDFPEDEKFGILKKEKLFLQVLKKPL